ncbi:hypothetical protein HBI46_008540 [Parastagonospora nodorum]|nr:hypothetical protein HBI46_008540 [Parastagonospora nodorum]KAH6006630.1 hypothetical protein HBI84_063790 [Parastagonospora nodorum]
MPSYADADLLGLAELPESAKPDVLSPVSFGSASKNATLKNSRNGVHRDSFSDLVGAMKAKKPYAWTPSPTPRPSLIDSTNGQQLASRDRNTSGRTILSPTAKTFVSPFTVAEYLEQQESAPFSPHTSGPQESVHMGLGARLAALTHELNDFSFGEARRQPQNPSPPAAPIFQSSQPQRFGPIDPPTPVESICQDSTVSVYPHPIEAARPPVSTYDRASEPTVRVTKLSWTSVLDELELVKRQKQEVEQQLATAQREHLAHLDEDHDNGAQLGKLKYQNEVNRNQKAAMSREIAKRDVKIKEQQLDIDNLDKKVTEIKDELERCSRVKGEVETLRKAHHLKAEQSVECARKIEAAMEQLRLERDAAVRANAHAGDHATRAQDLVETLTKREKMVTDLRQKLLEEQLRVTDFEDEVERLHELCNQENLDQVKKKLLEKTKDCDRFRTQLKLVEHHLKLSQSRLMTATNNGALLRGAAHIVAPNENCKLPKKVMSCSECYALNLPCDSGSRCRNCIESNKKCARWRCSLKHKLGVCERAPCAPPHDPDGWLVTEPRPEW